MTTPARLVLWDIDRTLLNVSDLIADAIRQAAADVLGIPAPSLAPIVGRPESASMLDTLVLNGLDESTARMRLPGALDALVRALQERARRFTTEGKVLPGVRTVLPRLAADPAFAQSVLTGSLRANAIVKLRHFGLHLHLELDVGAYGDDAFDRPSLVEIARARARERYGANFAGAATILVGDSLHDIDAGRRTGARVIGVATGIVSARDLREAGADVVFDDLADTARVMDALGAGPQAVSG